MFGAKDLEIFYGPSLPHFLECVCVCICRICDYIIVISPNNRFTFSNFCNYKFK